MTSPLEHKLVIAWRVWERSKENPAAVEEKERLLEAYCDGERITTHQLHDRITDKRRRGMRIEDAVRLSVIGLVLDTEGEG